MSGKKFKSETDAISALLFEKASDWKTVSKAFADAKKELTPKKKKGLPADGAPPPPTVQQLYERARALMDEPARQPAAVKGLARIKKETGLNIKLCRAAMEEVGHDADQALLLLKARHRKQLKPPPKKAPKLTRRVDTAIRYQDGFLFVVSRLAVLDKEQKRIERELARNGEHVGPVGDQCLMLKDKSGWKRIGRFYVYGDSVWGSPSACATTADGGIHYLVSTRSDDTKSLVTGVVSRSNAEAKPHRHKLPCIANGLAGGDRGLITSVFKSPKVWVKPTNGDWQALESPDGDQQARGLAAREGRFWASTPRFFGYHDGKIWTRLDGFPQTDPAPVERRAVSRVAFGTEGRLAALCRGNLWAGTEQRIDPLLYVEASSLEMIGDTIYYDREGFGVFARDEAGDRKVFDSLPGAYGKKQNPRLFSDGNTLYGFTDKMLYEKREDDSWEETSLDDLWESLGSDELWWTENPPDWFPKAQKARLPG